MYVLVHNGRIIQGITGPGLQQEACLQDTVPPLVTEERTFRTYRSNLSMSSSSSHICLRFFFVTLILSFNFGFSCGMSCCCHSKLRLLVWFSAFVLKSVELDNDDMGYFLHYQQFMTSELSYAIKNFLIWNFLKRARRLSLVLDNSIEYPVERSFPLCAPAYM